MATSLLEAIQDAQILQARTVFTHPLFLRRQEVCLMSSMQRYGFKSGEFVVYPAHGVGQISGIEEQEIAGTTLELLIINFKQNKMILRIPTSKFANVKMRKLSDPSKVHQALQVLSQRAHAGRGIWSIRAQEYEAKINSGGLIAIAEVVRDLHRPAGSPEQSYSEHQLYQVALDRLSREIAVVQLITEEEAVREMEGLLAARPPFRNKISVNG